MTKYCVFGVLFGITLTGWFVYALVSGEVLLSQSQLRTDVKSISRDADPLVFYLVLVGMAGLVSLYWFIYFWFLRKVVPRLEGASASSSE